VAVHEVDGWKADERFHWPVSNSNSVAGILSPRIGVGFLNVLIDALSIGAMLLGPLAGAQGMRSASPARAPQLVVKESLSTKVRTLVDQKLWVRRFGVPLLLGVNRDEIHQKVD
jgi:hypothetical protein